MTGACDRCGAESSELTKQAGLEVRGKDASTFRAAAWRGHCDPILRVATRPRSTAGQTSLFGKDGHGG